jgi:hypothetical protein
MPAPLIQDATEVRRWFDEGLTYREMSERHLEKYGVKITPTAFANFRARHGLKRRIARSTNLIPWAVKPEHQMRYMVQMLRCEARLREGRDISETEQHKLDLFKGRLRDEDAVVHYEPDTEQGFFLVAREEYDEDMVRMPPRVTKKGAVPGSTD